MALTFKLCRSKLKPKLELKLKFIQAAPVSGCEPELRLKLKFCSRLTFVGLLQFVGTALDFIARMAKPGHGCFSHPSLVAGTLPLAFGR